MTDIRFGTIVSAVLESLDFAESDLTGDERHYSRKALERYKAAVAQAIREAFDEADAPAPVPPELATCSHCGAPVEAEYRFCTRCRMPQTPEAAADILERLLVKDLGMNQDDPKVLAAIARVRKEEPALWDGLMQKIAVPVKAFGEDLEEA